jgi:hypothetical protein
MLLCIDFFSYTTEQYILVFKEDRANLDWQDGVGTTFEACLHGAYSYSGEQKNLDNKQNTGLHITSVNDMTDHASSLGKCTRILNVMPQLNPSCDRKEVLSPQIYFHEKNEKRASNNCAKPNGLEFHFCAAQVPKKDDPSLLQQKFSTNSNVGIRLSVGRNLRVLHHL